MTVRSSYRILVGVVVTMTLFAASPGVHAKPGITSVGTLERFPQEAVDTFGPEMTGTTSITRLFGGTLLPVLGARQLWQIYPDGLGRPRTGILVLDARNLKVIGSFVVDARLRRATVSPTGGGEWLHAVDGGRRVFLVTSNRRLLEVDTTTFAVRDLGALTVVLESPISSLDPLVPAGLTYDPETGDLLVLYGGPAAFSISNRLTVLQRIDLATGVRRSRVVRSCTGPLPQTDVGGSTYGAAVLADPDVVVVPCQAAPPGYLTTGVPPTSIVVRLPRTSLWDATGAESVLGVGVWMDAPLVDASGGRISVLDSFGRVTVVDGRAMHIVGTFQASMGDWNGIGAGLDPTTGRFFFQSDWGFGYVDARSTPLPPATVDLSAAAVGKERIVPDGNRVFVLPGSGLPPDSKPDHYTIYNVAP